jgi:hypothetical protein
MIAASCGGGVRVDLSERGEGCPGCEKCRPTTTPAPVSNDDADLARYIEAWQFMSDERGAAVKWLRELQRLRERGDGMSQMLADRLIRDLEYHGAMGTAQLVRDHMKTALTPATSQGAKCETCGGDGWRRADNGRPGGYTEPCPKCRPPKPEIRARILSGNDVIVDAVELGKLLEIRITQRAEGNLEGVNR